MIAKNIYRGLGIYDVKGSVHVFVKEYGLQLRKPHLGDFHLVCFVIAANFAFS